MMTYKTAFLVSLACIFQTNVHANLEEIEKFIQTHDEIMVEYTFKRDLDEEHIALQGNDQSLYASNNKGVKFIGMSGPNDQENMWIITENIEEIWAFLKNIVNITIIAHDPYSAHLPQATRATTSNDILLCLWHSFKQKHIQTIAMSATISEQICNHNVKQKIEEFIRTHDEIKVKYTFEPEHDKECIILRNYYWQTLFASNINDTKHMYITGRNGQLWEITENVKEIWSFLKNIVNVVLADYYRNFDDFDPHRSKIDHHWDYISTDILLCLWHPFKA